FCLPILVSELARGRQAFIEIKQRGIVISLGLRDRTQAFQGWNYNADRPDRVSYFQCLLVAVGCFLVFALSLIAESDVIENRGQGGLVVELRGKLQTLIQEIIGFWIVSLIQI